MAKKVAVVGAGCSGLTAIKCCLDEGLIPVCFESHYEIGGLWHFTEDVIDNRGCVMRSTVTNTSKELTSFSDFPIAANTPNFMHHTKLWRYLSEYARTFGLRTYIKFNTEVLSIRQAEGYDSTGKWKLESRNHHTGDVIVEVFDAVMVCTGYNSEKVMPNFEGMDVFEGRIVHTRDYKGHEEGADKGVVVVGLGNSASDIIKQAGKLGNKTFWSTRRGGWVLHKVTPSGLPFDLQVTSRLPYTIFSYLPKSAYLWYMEHIAQSRLNHTLYGLNPTHRINATRPLWCDELASRIMCGDVTIKPDVKRLTKSGVEFVDGSFEDDIGLILCATGYNFSFKFMNLPDVEVKNNRVSLYKYIFPPDIRPNTLAMIGFVHPTAPVTAMVELQCRWATRVFKGEAMLPEPRVMWDEVRRRELYIRDRFVESTRHTIQVDGISYMDDLAAEIGCKPDLLRLFVRDPRLAWACFTGPCTPYQYRLQGPGRWEGAREAILTQWERILQPLKTRTATVEADNTSVVYSAIAACVVVTSMCGILWYLCISFLFFN